jgi:uncharacterized protein
MKYVSPGAYFRELDFSLYVPNLSTTICGMVGTATKGPVNEPTLITSVPQFISMFGNPNPSHFMPYAALSYLRRGKVLIVVRVANLDPVEGAQTATATFNAVKPAFVKSTDEGQSFEIDETNNQLRIVVSDERTSPTTTIDATVSLAIGTYASAQTMAAQIAERLRRNALLADRVTAIVYGDAVTVVAFEPSTDVAIQILEAAENSADVVLGLALDKVYGIGAGQFQLKASSVGSWANRVTVQLIPKQDFSFDLVVFEGTPTNSAGFRTEIHPFLKLDDSTQKWIGTAIGSDLAAGDSATLKFVTDPADTIPAADALVLPERKSTALAGGSDALESVIAADYIGVVSPETTGLQHFRRVDTLDVNILCVPGITAPVVLNELLAVAEERGDAIAILDTPDNYNPQQVVDWHNGVGMFSSHQAFNSSYGAMYWPWIQIYDSYNGVDVWVPPSGQVASVYAYTDFISETWFAPAGFNRAHLVAATDVRYSPNHGEREHLLGNQNAINPIVKFPKEGITIWGQKTLQRKPSALDRVNVRRLLLYLRKVISTSVKYLLFEPNDAATWRHFVSLVRPFMESVLTRRGVYAYEIICDETTNPPHMIDNNTMGGRIYLQPTKTAEVINVDFVLTPTGASFEDLGKLVF